MISLRFGIELLVLSLFQAARSPTKLFTPIILSWIILATPGCNSPGDSFYPIGIYAAHETNDLAAIKNACFNIVTGPLTKSYLDSAASMKLHVLAAPVSG